MLNRPIAWAWALHVVALRWVIDDGRLRRDIEKDGGDEMIFTYEPGFLVGIFLAFPVGQS